MIKRLLALDGVLVACQFRDDGAFVDGYGLMQEEEMTSFAMFAHDYKRIVQGNADQLSMFTGLGGWTPPGGWVVHGQTRSVCSVANLVCLVETHQVSMTEVMREMQELSSW
jgi:roadblock/LC7 domain-containing protein